MSSTDYILTQLAELSLRVADLESNNATMKAELERLTNHPIPPKTGTSMNTSVPLATVGNAIPNFNPAYSRYFAPFSAPDQGHRRHYDTERPRDFRPPHHHNPHPRAYQRSAPVPAPRHYGSAAAGPSGPRKRDQKQMTIQDVLEANEQVTIRVNKGKDEEGKVIQTTCITRFDGTNLKVEECELVPSLKGTSTSKPGEILYKFIEELKSGGHIDRTFTTAPWKLCFVEREGQRLSLEQLRAKYD